MSKFPILKNLLDYNYLLKGCSSHIYIHLTYTFHGSNISYEYNDSSLYVNIPEKLYHTKILRHFQQSQTGENFTICILRFITRYKLL